MEPKHAAALADADHGLSEVRRLRDVLGELDDYQTAVLREALARIDAASFIHYREPFLWSSKKPSGNKTNPLRE